MTHSDPNGLLIIGDPQVSSTSPGRRMDDYSSAILKKIDQAALISNEFNLQAVITGDLFDEAGDSKARLIVRLIRSLKKFNRVPLCLMGNHDSFELNLTDDAAIAIFSEAGVVHLVDKPQNVDMQISGERVKLIMVPYGYEIPSHVEAEGVPASHVICFSHADVAFDGAYPGALVPHEIRGCSFLVNGHMHLTKPVIHEGETAWFNPGNISRMTIADIEHEPAVWEWHPGNQWAKPHYLDVAENVFDMTGLLAPVMVDGAMDAVRDEYSRMKEESEFVNALQARLSTEMPMSDRADVLREEITNKMNAMEVPSDVRAILDLVFERAKKA